MANHLLPDWSCRADTLLILLPGRVRGILVSQMQFPAKGPDVCLHFDDQFRLLRYSHGVRACTASTEAEILQHSGLLRDDLARCGGNPQFCASFGI